MIIKMCKPKDILERIIILFVVVEVQRFYGGNAIADILGSAASAAHYFSNLFSDRHRRVKKPGDPV